MDANKHFRGIVMELYIFISSSCRYCHKLIDGLERNGIEPNGIISIEENPESITKYAVRSVPTAIIFKDSMPYYQWTGYSKKIVEEITECINDDIPF